MVIRCILVNTGPGSSLHLLPPPSPAIASRGLSLPFPRGAGAPVARLLCHGRALWISAPGACGVRQESSRNGRVQQELLPLPIAAGWRRPALPGAGCVPPHCGRGHAARRLSPCQSQPPPPPPAPRPLLLVWLRAGTVWGSQKAGCSRVGAGAGLCRSPPEPSVLCDPSPGTRGAAWSEGHVSMFTPWAEPPGPARRRVGD